VERRGLTEFPPEGVRRVVEETHGEHVVQGWPALVDAGDGVDLLVLVTPAEQEVAMRAGVRRLLRLCVSPPVRYVVGVLDTREKLALGSTPHGSVPRLIDDALDAVLDAAVARSGGVPWERPSFDAILVTVREHVGDDLLRVVRLAASVLDLATEVRTRLPAVSSPRLEGMRTDVEDQLDALLTPTFLRDTGVERLPDLGRYLRAVQRRLDTAPEDTGRDQRRQQQVEAVTAAWLATLDVLEPAERETDVAREVRWMIEELRVNLFAQQLGTPHPISEKRIHKALDALLQG
jgi:ATP-dependent helicase HrpA